ncbi:conserved Plasmodium protein, unknown function [Plasmodium gaboni]|uniref:EMP3/KAHRP N-terminal domain-containing protein n=1 Tax=Plasmodium gaboni TaxID=647221 RepID=A0ABY1UH58_9APIC|nr:conserved Plasmodium protein, unknown function [Plasmodium gaboni]
MKKLFLLIYAITLFSIYVIKGAKRNDSSTKKKSLMSILFGNLFTKYKKKKKSSFKYSKSESDCSIPTELEDQVNYEIYSDENISNEVEEDIARDKCNKTYGELYKEQNKHDNYEDSYDNNYYQNYGIKKIANCHILDLHLGEYAPKEKKKNGSVNQIILFQNYYKENITNNNSNSLGENEYSFNFIYHPKEKEKEKKRRPKSMNLDSKSYDTFKEESYEKKKKKRWSTIGFSRKKINNFDCFEDLNISHFSYEEDNKAENNEKKYVQDIYGVQGIFAWTSEDALNLNPKPTRTQSLPHIVENNVNGEYEKKHDDDENDLFYYCIKEIKKREMEKEEEKQKEKLNIDLKNKNVNDPLDDDALLENIPHKEQYNYSCVTSNKNTYHEILENKKKDEIKELKNYLELLKEKRKENLEKIKLRRSSSFSQFNTNENSNSDFHPEKNYDKKLMLNEKSHLLNDNISEYSCCIEHIDMNN